MYLEFAGLPASGKSTLSSTLKKYLDTLPKQVFSRKEAMIQSLRRRDDGHVKNVLKLLPSRFWWPLMGSQFALPEFVSLSSRHLKFIIFISKMLSESNLPKRLIESIWDTTVRTFSEIQLISQHIGDSEIIIMDEAFFQRCFTLFGYMESTISDDLISHYAELAPISDHIFWIVTSPQSCVDRLKLRYQNQTSPYELSSRELIRNFESGNNVLMRLSNALESQGKCVHRIPGDDDKDVSIAKICKAAEMILAQKDLIKKV
ncbi:hypothetical protein [Desulfobacula phenolica]|uniref:Thymidylate kinase n=1 Tax=Desulfobacula phenolica TaxID=90732 RepID=A0A1H2DV86_9BACT|nr:hypothetical protein [Desulfobacula phenolica]SDT86348.1 hypothetical protein SAMN04487931_102190 [Desulfobacula phenolica]